MEDKLSGFSMNVSDSEIAAQRLLIAALAGGYVNTSGYGTDEAGAKKLGEFLGVAAVTLAKRLKAANDKA